MDDNRLQEAFTEIMEGIFEEELSDYAPVDKEEEDQIIAAGLESLEFIRKEFIKFQQRIEDTLMGEAISPAVWEFADYCAELNLILTGELEFDEADTETFEISRDVLLATLSRRLKGEGNVN